jgi:hypothetical protein
MSGTFSRQEIYSWFRRHHPEVKESSLSAHIQALTSNAPNRERNHPHYGVRQPLFDRVGHGLYRVHEAGGSPPQEPTGAATPPPSAPNLAAPTVPA